MNVVKLVLVGKWKNSTASLDDLILRILTFMYT